MLTIEKLTKYYRKTLAVDEVSFNVADGEIVGLLGPNGAGKTSILRCVAGIVQPTSGKILIDGHDLMMNEQKAKRALAFVPEVPNPFEMLTVYEHMRFVAMAYNTLEGFDARTEELLQRFDLHDKRNDLVLTLSKGMKQKMAVACAFIHQSRVLLFDEPLIGIDPKGVHELKEMMLQAKAGGASLLVSTHMLDTAERLCDRIIIMDHGRILAEGTLAELHEMAHMRADASLEELFLKLTEEGKDDAATPLP